MMHSEANEQRRELVADYRIRQYLAQRLKDLRSETSWKQEEIAKEIGRTQAQVSRYEKGQRLLPAEDLVRIARLFKVPVQDFFPPDLADQLTPEEVRLLRLWRRDDFASILRLVAEKIQK